MMKYRALACEEGILSILIQRNWRRKFVHGYWLEKSDFREITFDN